MSKAGSASKIRLSSIDSLFGNTETSNDIDATKEQVIEVPLADLHEFKGHPFRVQDDEKMEETVESVREHGVLVPGIVRTRTKGGYEIIAGHRRKHACELAGLETMPVFVRNLTDDEATIVMVDSNIQREEILPSEKARAYKMKYEAMKHQGAAGGKSGRSLEEMSAGSGESAKKIQRYIYLARLNDDLLGLVDEKKLGIAQGVDLSFLTQEEQVVLYDVMAELSVIPSMLQSAEIKALSKKGAFDVMSVRAVLVGEVKPKKRNITIRSDRISEYFSDDYSEEAITEVILELLEEWKARKEDA